MVQFSMVEEEGRRAGICQAIEKRAEVSKTRQHSCSSPEGSATKLGGGRSESD